MVFVAAFLVQKAAWLPQKVIKHWNNEAFSFFVEKNAVLVAAKKVWFYKQSC
jgi:hypothetical protein